jgi:predicted anti-sigma-YlaC factor YlaD
MRCNEIRSYLPAYLEGALPPEEAQRVEQHLQACIACTRERNLLERVPILLRQWSPDVPSERIWAGIEQRIQTAARARRGMTHRARTWRNPLVAATLAVAATALALFFLWNRPEPTYPPPPSHYGNYWQAHHEWARNGGATELYPYLEVR